MVTQWTETPKPARTHWADLSPGNLVRIAWQGRFRLLISTVGCTLIGVVIALLTEPEFVSEARIMPEINSSSGGLFKRLASVAGFSGYDLSTAEGVDAVRPDLYPNVLQSTPFIVYLMAQPVVKTSGERTTVTALLKPGWEPFAEWFGDEEDGNRPIELIAGKPVRLTRRQEKLIQDIEKRLSARLDTRSGVIAITAKMPDANVAATVAQLAMDYLTHYVTSYRTEKARQDLLFYTQRLNEARQRYQTTQYAVFHYNDQHKYYVVQAATLERQRLEAELGIAQTVYTELARQFEQAKLKVQEQTPVFKVLEPAKIPLVRVSPRRFVMVLLFTLAGVVAGLIYLVALRVDVAGRLRLLMQE